VKDITPGKGIWFCEIYLSEKTGLIKSDGKKDQQHPLSGKGMLLSPLRATSNYRKRAKSTYSKEKAFTSGFKPELIHSKAPMNPEFLPAKS
jgi:hypothetical protein